MYSLTIARTFNVAARTKTIVNTVVHMERPPFSPTTLESCSPIEAKIRDPP